DRKGQQAATTSPLRSHVTSFPLAVLDHRPRESQMDRKFPTDAGDPSLEQFDLSDGSVES
ncbi:MAG: hypothetical protein ACK5AM_06105, partial [Pirellulaceae bacterium]